METRGFIGVDDSTEKITLEKIPSLIESIVFFHRLFHCRKIPFSIIKLVKQLNMYRNFWFIL